MKVCPSGWHLPTKEEWKLLLQYLGGKKDANRKLISSNAWSYKLVGTNSSGFNALPGGYLTFVNQDRKYVGIHEEAGWWTSTGNIMDTSRSIWSRGRISFWNIDINEGLSVRCLKN